tara:strand:+ start:11290 stop:13359 length:2070 start_codon:yes stop_codon:yes gene_type:complete
MYQFGADGGLLHMTNPEGVVIDLYTAVGDVDFIPAREILACRLDSQKSLDGSRGLTERPPLRECIAALVHTGHKVQMKWVDSMTPSESNDRVCFSCEEGSLPTLLSSSPPKTLRRVSPVSSVASTRGYVLQTEPPLLYPPTVPSDTPWQTLVDSTDLRLRVSCTCSGHVRLYRNGILEEEECNNHIGLSICVEHSGRSYSFPTRTSQLSVFVRHFLTPCTVVAFSESRIVLSFMKKAAQWREALWDAATLRGEDYTTMVSQMPDEYVMMIDPRRFPETMLVDERVKHLAMIASHRLYPPLIEHRGDIYDNMVDTFDVDAIGTLPFDRTRVAHLHELGFFKDMAYASCKGGILTSDHRRILLFPHDADEVDITVAMTQLLAPDANPESIEDWVLCSDKVITQQFKEAGSNDTFEAFRLDVTPEGVISLVRDREHATRRASEAMCLDDLRIEDIPFDPLQRRNRPLFKRLFPELSSRIESGRYEDFLVDVRCRKTRYDWSYEDIDNGGDLSSLGMSVLMSLLLTLWYGAAARLYVSIQRTAMVGVHTIDGMVLVDPCSSLCNAISLNFENVGAHTSTVRKGTLVEVKCMNKWLVGVVEGVKKTHRHHSDLCATASVRLIGSNRLRGISLSSKTWRVLARCKESDVDKVLGSLLRRSMATRPTAPAPAPPSSTTTTSTFDVDEVVSHRGPPA